MTLSLLAEVHLSIDELAKLFEDSVQQLLAIPLVSLEGGQQVALFLVGISHSARNLTHMTEKGFAHTQLKLWSQDIGGIN